MQKGFAQPLLVIALIAFVGLAAAISLTNSNIISDENVKGVKSTGISDSKPGLMFNVISPSGTWELIQYLCKTKDECDSSISSGKRLGSVGGGKTELQKVTLPVSPEWTDYSYIKVLVKSGWNSSSGKDLYKASVLDQASGTYRKVFGEYESVIVPIETPVNTLVQVAEFSDH